ncbi:MAG: hypothetical protein K6E59_04840 [Bacilli bacterium]|nr:hypothetical protein [Bacilli bacterium]
MTKRILFSLAALTLLASCGNNGNRPAGEEIQKDVATTRYKNIASKLKDGSVTIPGKFTATTKMDLGSAGYKLESLNAADPEAHYWHSKTVSSGVDQGREYNVNMEVWAYAEGEKYIVAMAESDPSGSEAKYVEFASWTVAEPIVSVELKSLTSDVKKLTSDFMTTVEQVLTTDFGSMIGLQSGTSIEGVTIDKYNVSPKYYSTGEGNLSVVINVDIAATESGKSSSVAGDVSMTIDQYLPQNLKIGYATELDGQKANNSTEIAFQWNQVDQNKPDLSKFEKTSIDLD